MAKLQGHSIDCPCCGGQAEISVTKHNTIFTWCKTVIDQQSGEFCGYRGFLGKRESARILSQIQNEEKNHVQSEQETTRETQPAGNGEAVSGEDAGIDGATGEPAGKSFFARIFSDD